jgi:class 3 adenylate cyclase
VALTVSAVATVGIGAAGQIGEVSCFVLMVLLLGAQLPYSHFFFRLRTSLTALHLIGVVVAIVVCLGPDQYAALWAHVAAWGLSLVPAYFQERHTRQVFLASLQLCSRKAELTGAKKKVEHTLYKVLPQSIVRRVYRNPDRAIVDFAEDASVLFVYFHLRTEGEGGGAEARPMAQLDALVALLDRMVDLTPGVEKIKTLPYLVVAGLPDENPRHAPALAALARNIFRHLGRLSVDVRRNLRLQVGIHSGPLCAGLLGKNKFIYDVFGDTVNVASRLAAASEDARVMVSEAFMRKCGDAEDFEERGVVELRNRGPVRCFYLCLHNKAEVTPISPSST